MTTPSNTDTREFIDAFSGDTDTASKPEPGLGIDPRQADTEAMASAFNAADVSVDTPMPTRDIEASTSTQPLPPASAEPAEAVKPVAAAPTTAIDAADVAIGGPMRVPDMKARPLHPPSGAVQPPAFKTFGQAFKWHREQATNGGPKVFEWNGKKFTTRLKTEAAATRPAARSAGARTPVSATSRTTPAMTKLAPAAVPATAAPVAMQFKPAQTPAAAPDKPLHVRQQEAYDEWQRQLSESKTWRGGQATMRPFQKERLQEAERNFDKLLSATK